MIYKDKLLELIKMVAKPFSQAIEEAPKQIGCYMMFLEDIPVYVGRTTDQDLKTRLSQHYNRTLDQAESFSEKMVATNKDQIKVYYQAIESQQEAKEIEKLWITNFSPKWNGRVG